MYVPCILSYTANVDPKIVIQNVDRSIDSRNTLHVMHHYELFVTVQTLSIMIDKFVLKITLPHVTKVSIPIASNKSVLNQTN